MKQNEVFIKWTGSKRYQAAEIIRRFPRSVRVYYEPFLGGASILYALLSSNIPVERFECSDVCGPLIGIWKTLQITPDDLFEFYCQYWPYTKDTYYELRRQFNEDQDPRKFFCLLRTCRNGLVRFNKAGNFTSGFHLGRSGIRPETLKTVFADWRSKMQGRDVRFYVRDYREIQSDPGDYVYLDPPYRMTGTFYSGEIDFADLWAWMRKQSSYALSLNGFKSEKDCRVEVPTDLYQDHCLVYNGTNKFDQLVGNYVMAYDSLYLKA